MKKRYYIYIILGLLFICLFFSDELNKKRTMKEIIYNGDKLLVSIDGLSSASLPTSGIYYLTNYTCNDNNTKITWNSSNYKLDVSNGKKGGGVSCSLEFKSTMKLSEVPVGSYVAYEGKGGTVGTTAVACKKGGTASSSTAADATEAPNSCLGQNAREDIEENGEHIYGYCFKSENRFYVTGWRLAYVDDNGKPVIISAGSPECNTRTSIAANATYIKVANALSLKYCNTEFVDGDCTCASSTSGQCSSPSTDAWAINENSFNLITKAITGTAGGYLFTAISGATQCGSIYATEVCGYNNDLIDNGGFYWFAALNTSSSKNGVIWRPSERRSDYSTGTDAAGLRPLISLKSSVYVTGGLGTMEQPYTIAVKDSSDFSINGGDEMIDAEGSSNVLLTLPYDGAVSTMCISVNSSVCTNYIAYQNSYTLDWSSEKDGEKTVYVYYKNSAGKIVNTMVDSIMLSKESVEDTEVKYIFNRGYVSDGITSMTVLDGNGSLGKYSYVEGRYIQLTSGWTSGQSLGNVSVRSNNVDIPAGSTQLCYKVSFFRNPETTDNNVSSISFGDVSQSFNMTTSSTTETGCLDISTLNGSQYFQANLDCGIYNSAGYSNAELNIHYLYFK